MSGPKSERLELQESKADVTVFICLPVMDLRWNDRTVEGKSNRNNQSRQALKYRNAEAGNTRKEVPLGQNVVVCRAFYRFFQRLKRS
jgi:hypothetical protein